jgi:hypothetical protein
VTTVSRGGFADAEGATLADADAESGLLGAGVVDDAADVDVVGAVPDGGLAWIRPSLRTGPEKGSCHASSLHSLEGLLDHCH